MADMTEPGSAATLSVEFLGKLAEQIDAKRRDKGAVWVVAHPDGPIAKAGITALGGVTIEFEPLHFMSIDGEEPDRDLGLSEVYISDGNPFDLGDDDGY